MFDIQQRTTLGELSTPFIKYVVWSADMNHVALLSKHAIIIAKKKLGNASTGIINLSQPHSGLLTVEIPHSWCGDPIQLMYRMAVS